ncbi:MAG: hypothetical protein JWO68_1583 [Actinomycetia bacterium]|nr:hypothetical protein [Actinomycetes bacterium]
MSDVPVVLERSLAGARVSAERYGAGPPVVVLHHSHGPLAWEAPWSDLAADHEVWLVDVPGYGRSEQPAWARSARDLAVLLGLWLDGVGLGQPTVVGLGLGGWVASELATLAPGRLGPLVLVGSAGLRPAKGAILDQFLISHVDYARAYFADEARYRERYGDVPSMATLQRWADSREMTVRVSWKPYMYSRQLEALLPAVGVAAHVVWGEHDAVVPVECGERFAALLGGRLHVVPGCGHAVDLEAPSLLEQLIRDVVATKEP